MVRRCKTPPAAVKTPQLFLPDSSAMRFTTRAAATKPKVPVTMVAEPKPDEACCRRQRIWSDRHCHPAAGIAAARWKIHRE